MLRSSCPIYTHLLLLVTNKSTDDVMKLPLPRVTITAPFPHRGGGGGGVLPLLPPAHTPVERLAPTGKSTGDHTLPIFFDRQQVAAGLAPTLSQSLGRDHQVSLSPHWRLILAISRTNVHNNRTLLLLLWHRRLDLRLFES